LLGFAIGASLMFARFSNPATKIIFSTKAVIAPYQQITGFMLRIINGRSNELIQVNAVLTLAINNKEGKRAFVVLPLERDSVLVFPLNWTIVHPIDQNSPLFGMTSEDLEKYNAEFLISITAVDQDLSKTVYARSSYVHNEVEVGAKFSAILEKTSDGTVTADPKRISDIEKL
jgi:inward rectifier potassium channel